MNFKCRKSVISLVVDNIHATNLVPGVIIKLPSALDVRLLNSRRNDVAHDRFRVGRAELVAQADDMAQLVQKNILKDGQIPLGEGVLVDKKNVTRVGVGEEGLGQYVALGLATVLEHKGGVFDARHPLEGDAEVVRVPLVCRLGELVSGVAGVGQGRVAPVESCPPEDLTLFPAGNKVAHVENDGGRDLLRHAHVASDLQDGERSRRACLPDVQRSVYESGVRLKCVATLFRNLALGGGLTGGGTGSLGQCVRCPGRQLLCPFVERGKDFPKPDLTLM